MAVAFDFDAVPVPEQVRPFSGMVRGLPRFTALPLDLTCAVVTGDESLRRRLVAAAELVGWDADESPTQAAAFDATRRRDFRLVVIDLVSAPDAAIASSRSLAAELAGRPDTLLIVCGDADDRRQEIWARSLGAFAYVPGVAAGDSLISVFREARIVSERRHAPSRGTSNPSIASDPTCVRS